MGLLSCALEHGQSSLMDSLFGDLLGETAVVIIVILIGPLSSIDICVNKTNKQKQQTSNTNVFSKYRGFAHTEVANLPTQFNIS